MSDISDGSSRRSEYLLGGRRVKVADLIAAGLLEAGSALIFRRRRAGDAHRAEVLPSGQLRLVDGRVFASLSRAAAAAAGVRALDGWHAWRVEASGVTLDGLRQQLLDQAVDEVVAVRGDGDPESAIDSRARHERLKEFRRQAESGAPVEMSVRDLLDLWGAGGRGYKVSSRIEAELANHGLSTEPHWQKVTLDARVRLEPLVDADEGLAAVEQESLSVEDDETEDLDVGLTAGNLPSALGGVVHVSPNSSIDEAVTLMLLNDFSQLAVLSGERSLKGAVTWKSIAQARHSNPAAKLAEATIEAEVVPYDRELIDLLPTLYSNEFVFIRDQSNVVCGIVTASDVVAAYGELATPFFLIGELDQLLRRLIAQEFTLDAVRGLCDQEGNRSILSFEELTLGDYQQVLQNPTLWAQLGWPLDRAIFCRRLDELREVRNDVMHFNPDPLDVGAIKKLRSLIRLLRQYGE